MARAKFGDRGPSGAIAGSISTRAGAAVPGAAVMIVGDSPTHLDIAAVTGADGDYALGELVPGEYEIQVNVADRLQVQRVQVRPGEVARLDFQVED
jgi:hypothetical protein